MVIRIYVEGGGQKADARDDLRVGMSKFLDPVRQVDRNRRNKLKITFCGSRREAFDRFRGALKLHHQDFNILLVDSEGPLTNPLWRYLEQRDSWSISDVSEDQCQLMVQIMEAWLASDLKALEKFYGQGFNSNPILNMNDIESIDKDQLVSSLENATRNSTKRMYHKIRHAPELLASLNADVVRERAPHCDRLFKTLEKIIAE